MGYRLNRLDEPVFMAVPKPMLTEFGIHYRLESCVSFSTFYLWGRTCSAHAAMGGGGHLNACTVKSLNHKDPQLETASGVGV